MLTTVETISAYLELAFESEDPAIISHAMGVVARAKGMTEVAKKAGLTRESFYKALSAEGNPVSQLRGAFHGRAEALPDSFV